MQNNSLKRCLSAALTCVACTFFSLFGARAGTTGGIQGYASDTGGHPIAGVNVSAIAPSGHAEAITGPGGFYSVNGLPLDTYTVTFAKDGYLTQSISDIATVQDQSIRVNARLESVKTLARIFVRGSTSLVQPAVTADTYVVDQTRLSDINGTPQDLNGYQAVESLPGVTPANASPLALNGFFPTIRAGAVNEVGYQYDGVDSTNPINGLFGPTFMPLNGVRSIQLSTGGYDVSAGNTNSGVINEVIRRGTYPAGGEATIRLASPIFGHEISFDYGSATPNNRFSYYFSVGGQRAAFDYGNRTTLLPLLLGNLSSQTLNDDVLNLFYRFSRGDKDELQFLSNVTSLTATLNYLADPSIAPYASNNGNVQAASDPFGLRNFSTYQSSYITLFPSQAAYRQNIGAADTATINSVIDKINLKRQVTPSSFLELRFFHTGNNSVGWFPYSFGSFSDSYFGLQTTGLGEAFDYANQINAKHELSFGADGVYYKSQLSNGGASLEPFFEPLEDLGCPQAANALGRVPVGGCYIAPFNAALNARYGLGLPTDPGHAPLRTYVSDFFQWTNSLHRWDLYVKDRYQPSQRLSITFGLRWDKESIPLPANAAQLNTTYYIDGSGNVVTLPGRLIGTDVTQPSQISPRIGMSYQMSPRDAVRFSYGKNIEFALLASVDNAYQIPGSLQNCDITSGCFIPLPGYGKTNHVANLYQQVLLDLNTKNFVQYTPVLPQTAVNLDFSYEHDFGRELELRVTPYYRKGTNYAVSSQQLLFALPSGTPVFGATKEESAGINENTGVEFALQRNAEFGLSGLLAATYDNTLANYNSDFFPSLNSAALAAGHFFHVTYVAPLTGTLNLVYNSRRRLHVSTTVSYAWGYRYGVGKKTFVFGPGGAPVQVLNTDLAATSGVRGAYYLTNSSNPGTVFAPNIVASRGTPEGDDPGSLFGPAIITVNLTLAQELGGKPKGFEVGIRVQNVFGNYSPAQILSNPYYGFSGFGNHGLTSGVNPNACAPGQTFACEPFQYRYSPFPYEQEQIGPPRVYTFFISTKY